MEGFRGSENNTGERVNSLRRNSLRREQSSVPSGQPLCLRGLTGDGIPKSALPVTAAGSMVALPRCRLQCSLSRAASASLHPPQAALSSGAFRQGGLLVTFPPSLPCEREGDRFSGGGIPWKRKQHGGTGKFSTEKFSAERTILSPFGTAPLPKGPNGGWNPQIGSAGDSRRFNGRLAALPLAMLPFAGRLRFAASATGGAQLRCLSTRGPFCYVPSRPPL